MGSVKKTVVLGALGAGKRALLQKITADGVSTKASLTVGLRIYSLAVGSGELEKMVFWELTNAGSLTLQPIDYLKGAYAEIYVFDLSRPSTCEELDQGLKILKSMLPECPLIIRICDKQWRTYCQKANQQKSIGKAWTPSSTKRKKIALTLADEIQLISLATMIRIEADSNYAKFFLIDGEEILVSKHLGFYYDILKNFGFMRVHQSHLVNQKFVDRYVKRDGGYLVLTNGHQVPISRTQKENLLKWFSSLLCFFHLEPAERSTNFGQILRQAQNEK